MLSEQILPKVQYYAYVEITPEEHQSLWHEYEKVHARHPDRFSLQQLADAGDIYPVFRQLFERRIA